MPKYEAPMLGGTTATPKESNLKSWCELYGEEFVDKGIKEAIMWLKTHPKRRKKNLDAYLNNWLRNNHKQRGNVPAPKTDVNKYKFNKED
jgi:hypothetical protein